NFFTIIFFSLSGNKKFFWYLIVFIHFNYFPPVSLILGSIITYRRSIISMMTTNKKANKRVVPMIVGGSLTITDVTNCSPIPGTAEIFFITNVPVIKLTGIGSITVTKGNKALPNPILNNNPYPLIPLSLAVRI